MCLTKERFASAVNAIVLLKRLGEREKDRGSAEIRNDNLEMVIVPLDIRWGRDEKKLRVIPGVSTSGWWLKTQHEVEKKEMRAKGSYDRMSPLRNLKKGPAIRK